MSRRDAVALGINVYRVMFVQLLFTMINLACVIKRRLVGQVVVLAKEEVAGVVPWIKQSLHKTLRGGSMPCLDMIFYGGTAG